MATKLDSHRNHTVKGFGWCEVSWLRLIMQVRIRGGGGISHKSRWKLMEPLKQYSLPNPRLLSQFHWLQMCWTQHPSYMKSPWRSLGGAEPLWQRKWKIQNNPEIQTESTQIKEGATAHKKCSLFHFKLKQVHYKDNKHLLYLPEEGECKENGHINLGEFQGSTSILFS